MAIHSPPRYRYSLSDQWNKEAFAFLQEIARTRRYPRLLGTKDDKNRFLIMLIRTQKALHGWEVFLKDVLDQAKALRVINTVPLNKKNPPESISKETPAWVTYEEDKIVSDFIDSLETRNIDFHGTDEEMAEFIFRFILGQLAHDWEATIMMIWEMLSEGDSLSLKELNAEMKNFDYAKLWKKE